ncbi:pentapeptide repeat-containing protein [Microcoleus sp. FACHB-53]|nr:pentapeptide repeat-containing protein [Microcoleus sp. FACHB-53]
MAEPKLNHRYPNAATALQALGFIDVVGKATTSGNVERAINFRLSAGKILLLSFGLVAAIATSLSIGNKRDNIGDAVSQLRDTRQCQACNLKGTDLRGMDLRRVDLTDADLSGADLRNADLRSSNLQNADLSNANLSDADFRGADLRGADLWGAEHQGANLNSADIRDATMPKD